MIEKPKGTVTLTITENGQQIHREVLTKSATDDPPEFNARAWRRVWELQEQFSAQVQAGLMRERERQAHES